MSGTVGGTAERRYARRGMPSLRTCAALAICALTFAGAASAHDRFVDGPRSAQLIERALNRQATFDRVACEYQRPHVKCWGRYREERTDAWMLFRMTVHKTAPKKGYAMVCLVGFDFCERRPMTFTR